MNITSYVEFNKAARALNKRGVSFASDFAEFVPAAIMFFHGEGNKNVEILNSVIAIAYNASGMNAGHLMDYISQTVPHRVVKDKDMVRRHKFAGLIVGREYPAMFDVELFLLENPMWAEWGKGAAKAPEFNAATWKRSLLTVLARGFANGKDEGDVLAMFEDARIKAKRPPVMEGEAIAA